VGTDLTSEEHRSDQCATTQSGDFEAEDTHRDRKALLTVKIRKPSHEFTFGVGISFIPYPLVLTPVV
jgi:hypothetical protein